MAIIINAHEVKMLIRYLNNIVSGADKLEAGGVYFPAAFDARYARDRFVEMFVTDAVAEAPAASADIVPLAAE
jgi:hypothetical protein